MHHAVSKLGSSPSLRPFSPRKLPQACGEAMLQGSRPRRIRPERLVRKGKRTESETTSWPDSETNLGQTTVFGVSNLSSLNSCAAVGRSFNISTPTPARLKGCARMALIIFNLTVLWFALVSNILHCLCLCATSILLLPVLLSVCVRVLSSLLFSSYMVFPFFP